MIGFKDIIKLFRVKHWISMLAFAGIGFGLMFAAGWTIGRITGGAAEKVSCAENKVNELTEGAKNHAKKIQKNSALGDDDLDRRWCSWVLDMPFDECLTRNRAVREGSGDEGHQDPDRDTQRRGRR